MTSADEPATPPDPGGGGLVRLRLDLSYDGTAFFGWACQPGLRTVQGTVEAALMTVLRLPEPAGLTVAGRTDAGVHATGQVVSVDLPPALVAAAGTDDLLRRLAAVLPADVRVRGVAPAPEGFEARFSALSRAYAYRVTDARWGVDPLRRHDTLVHARPLDLCLLRQASSALLGEHDFRAYCRRREGATTVRRLLRLDWSRGVDGVLEASVEADAFCHSMVRSLVGALLRVGEGRRPPSWPAEVLWAGVRDSAATVAPARGLTLVTVSYPPDSELASRAMLTRRLRT